MELPLQCRPPWPRLAPCCTCSSHKQNPHLLSSPGSGLEMVCQLSPKKLYERILNWEFIDLGELRPVGTLERLNPDPDPLKYVIMSGMEVARAKKKPITDIFRWIECFTIYVAVLASKYPSVVPELLAYMLVIIKAQREYEEPAWRLYDEAFRDKAAAMGNKKWAQVDPHIYDQVFTGRACRTALCGICDSIGHTGDGCPNSRSLPKKRLSAGDGPSAKYAARTASPQAAQQPSDICWSFNKSPSGKCKFGNVCRFKHMCATCLGRHPMLACTKKSESK